jgi:hypothetical protein
VTLTPLVRSNSGNSFSYAPPKPPDIRTFSSASATVGEFSIMATMTNVPRTTVAVGNENGIIVGPLRLMMTARRPPIASALPLQ